MREFLKGKKTYLTAALAIAGVGLSYAAGEVTAADAARLAVEAVLAMTLRAGIAKAPLAA
jgi:hypothetical protein